MAANSNLHAAKTAKNDEFYTQRRDIENELHHYADHFRGKVVYCNCDDPESSEFWRFFMRNFEPWGITKLLSTHYDPENESYGMVYEGGNEKHDYSGNRFPLTQHGDFRSEECIALLKEADIVVTNPPFSLFREYVAQLMEHEKKFLIIGNLNAITYKEFFPLLKNNEVWTGATCFNGGATYFVGDISLYDEKKMSNPKNAYVKDGKFYWRVNGVRWYTNLDHKKRHQSLDLRGNYYDPELYPKYDNYDAIEVSKVANIPCDYNGVIGVPISFMDKYCPEQFEIVGQMANNHVDNCNLGYPFVGGKRKYARILIRRKQVQV